MAKKYKKRYENNTEEKLEERRQQKLSSSAEEKPFSLEDYGKNLLGKKFGMDTFERDLQNMTSTVNSISSEWQTQETMQNTKSSVEDMMKRIDAYQTYQKRYGGEDLTELHGGYKQLLKKWDDLSGVYAGFENADAFNKARTKSILDKQFTGLTYDEVQEQLKQYDKDSDEYKYLSQYTGYTDLREFDKALEAYKKPSATKEELQSKYPTTSQEDIRERLKQAKTMTPSVAGGSAVTYNSADGQDDYIKRLETARNQYALDNTFDLYKQYLDADDFEWKSRYESTKDDSFGSRLTSQYGMGYDDVTYEYINNVNGIRDEIKREARAFGADTGDGVSSMEKKGYDKLNEDEVAVYNYIYRTEGKDKAQKFLDDMEITLTKRVYDEATGRWEKATDSGVGASVFMSALTVPTRMVGAVSGTLDSISDYIDGKKYNPYGYYKMPTNFANDTREYVGENIAEATEGFEIFGQNIPSFLYQTGMSVADTAVGGTMFGKSYTVLMGFSSAQQTAKELKEAGATSEQLALGSAMAGLIEMGTEYISIDHLFKIKGADSLKKILTETAKQAGIEASEEFLAEVANLVVDEHNRGRQSDTYKMYEDYIARGFSEEEAEKKVKQELAKQIGFATVGGALSGFALGGVSSLTSHHNLSKTGEAIRENDRVSEMMNLEGLTPEESEAYKLYNEYAKKGITEDNISNAQLGNLYQTSKSEAKDIIESKKTTTEQKVDAINRLGKLGVVNTSKSDEERAIQQRAESLKKGEVTEVNSTGNATKIEGIKIEDGKTIVRTGEGEFDVDEMTFSANDAKIIAYAENMGEEKGNLMLFMYDNKVNADDFAKSFELAYSYGEIGMGVDSVLKNKGVLYDWQASTIYKQAMLNKSNERQRAIDEINEKHSKTVFVEGKFDDSIIDYDGTVTDGSKIAWKDLTKTQRNAITFAKGFSKATGVNITFIQSEVKDGKRVGKNGSYNPATNTIEIDVYAGIVDAKTVKDSIIPTLSHEMTHWMKAKSPAMYAKIREHALETLAMTGSISSDERVAIEMNRIKQAHPNVEVTEEMAIDEIVARTCEDMLSNSNTARKLLNQMSKKEQNAFVAKVKETFNNLMEWVNELLSKYKSNSKEAEILREYKHRLKELSKMWDKALAEAIQSNQSLQAEGVTGEEVINAIGVGVDMDTESAYPSEQFSERTWTESEYVQNREVAVSNLANALGISKKKAGNYVDAINSVARLIADDRVRLDYDSNIDENATVVKPNSDYKWSIDMSTLCAKRLLFTGTFDAIQKMLPNTALDSDDIVKIRKMMMDKGYQVACGICYVESTRREIGTITKDFIERYKIAQKTGKPIARVNSSGKEVDLVESGTKARFYAEEGYTPTLAELNTTDIDLVKRDHPSVYGAYLSYMNARGQAKPKLLETRAEYKGEIASKFKRKKNGELNASTISMNESGGLRLQSFSDFEVAHLIDMMQVVMDMSNVGLMSQAYTKVPEFAEVFGDTGVKINLSLIAKENGLDENGELIFDDVEGIDHKKAFALRDKFSKNVGTILVGKNDAHIIKAMSDTRIDYIIPFHKSSWKESLYDALGLTGYADYTDTQHEKSIDPNRKIKDFMPSEYWDFSKSGDENAQIYLEKCKVDGRIPKFPQFAQYDGYWKLLIDFKMYDNNGVGSPQTQVMPNFDMESANRILNEYEGGHRNFPVAKDVVDEFVADYKKEHPHEQYGTIFELNKNRDISETMGGVENNSSLSPTDDISMENIAQEEGFGQYSDRKSSTDWLIDSIDDYLANLSIEDLLDEVSDDANTNIDTPKVERAKRRVDEVNKRLKEIGLSFNGTKSLAWTDERIDKYLSGGYYGSSNPKYAQAYITYVTPQQFLNLTAGSKLHTVDMIQNESEAYGEVDIEKLGNSTPIFLEIEEGKTKAEVTGHEGRHRMYMLGKAGVERVPVLLFDYRTKYDKTAKNELKLTAQRFNEDDFISKSRDVVVNDVIPFSQGNRDLIVEKFGSGNKTADIRFADRDNVSVYDAMGETESLKKQNAILKADIERLKERLKLERQVTNGNAFNEKQLTAVANHIRSLAKSDYAEATLVDELREVYSYITETPQLDWEVLMAKSYDVARRVLDSSKGYKVTNDYFKSILDNIRKERIMLNAEQIQEAKNAFGEKYRDAFMGKVILVKEGTSLDQKWQEWSAMYPEIFNADIAVSDQITELYDIYNSLREGAEMYQIFNDEESVRSLATEIYNQYWNVSTIRTTADKYESKIKRINYEHRKTMSELREGYKKRIENQKTADAMHYGKVISKLRQQRDERVSEARRLGKKRLDEYKDRAERNAKIQSITKKSLTLNQWLTKNSRDEHIPEVMKAPVAYLLNAIDFSSKQLLGMRNGSNAGMPTKRDISLSKALEQVHDMVAKINSAQIGEDEITEIYGTFADFPAGFADDIRELSSTVNDVMRTVGDNAYVLNQMNLEQLETLDKIVTIIKATVTKMNKFLAVRHGEGVASLSQKSINDMDKLGKIQTHDGLRGGAEKLVNWGNALPYYTFKRFGDGGQKVYEALQDGWDKFAFHVNDIIKYSEKTYTSEEVKEWSEMVHEFDVLEPATEEVMASSDYVPKYQKVKMSVPQIMSLYCLQKREQAKSHLVGGGMRVADIKTKKGVITQTEGAILSESEIDMIVGSLTARQKVVADKLQEFMNTTCTDWGNEVSMIRFGFKAFGEENYFPIQSDKNNLAVNDETEQNNSLFRLLNMSFTKGLVQNANNRIVISDIFDVFAQHSSDMAKYNALALPVVDSFKWYNYKEKIKKGETQFKTKSVKQSMENAFGKDAQNYFTTFLRDINGEHSAGRDSVGGGFFTNAKIASVGFNMRVVALQPTSYVRASAVIDPKYLAKAFGHKLKYEEEVVNGKRKKVLVAEKHCGIALWKSLGFYDINVQNGVSDIIKHNQTTKDKIVDASMKGAEMADKVTWGYLWNACELEVRDKRKDLKVGSKEFYDAVAKRLREVIYSTQVVDSTMTRSHMMRSKDGKDKMLTAFASEPTLSYNMLQDCYYDIKLTQRETGSLKTALSKNGKKMARVFTAYAVTNMLCALVEAGFDAFRDDEEELTAEEFMKLYWKNLASDMSILNKIPYAKELMSMLQGYSSSRTDTQWMQYMVNTLKGFGKLLEGEGNAYTTAKNAMRAFSQASGLPFYNAYRDFMALLDKVDILTTEEVEEMFNETVGEMFPSQKTK